MAGARGGSGEGETSSDSRVWSGVQRVLLGGDGRTDMSQLSR